MEAGVRVVWFDTARTASTLHLAIRPAAKVAMRLTSDFRMHLVKKQRRLMTRQTSLKA